jgi:hypothetical protein
MTKDDHFNAFLYDMDTRVFPVYAEKHKNIFVVLWEVWHLISQLISQYFALWSFNVKRDDFREMRGLIVKSTLFIQHRDPTLVQFCRDVYDTFERHVLYFMDAQKLSLSQINEEARLSHDPIRWIKDASGHFKPVVTLSKDAISAPASSSVNSAANSSKAASDSRVKSKPPPPPANTLLAPNKKPSVQRDSLRADSPQRSPRLRVRSPSSSRKRPWSL